MTAAAPDFGGLALLLDGYFHEDFRLEHGDHEGAARAFVRDASPAEREEARAAMERFIDWTRTVSKHEWQHALSGAGGAWRPRSLAPLRDVLAILSSQD